jgi:hypothetical protein
VTVVSGMPRSGTSLMMRMLDAGGIPALTDGSRAADSHNPNGYFEDARVRSLGRDAGWLEEARGRSVKIIYRLLRHLPAALEYRIVFMDRDLNEVYESQQDMLESSQDPAASQDRDSIIRALRREIETTKVWLAAQPNMRCIAVPYAELVREPPYWVRKVAQFLDGELDEPSMAACADPSLYRHRTR